MGREQAASARRHGCGTGLGRAGSGFDAFDDEGRYIAEAGEEEWGSNDAGRAGEPEVRGLWGKEKIFFGIFFKKVLNING